MTVKFFSALLLLTLAGRAAEPSGAGQLDALAGQWVALRSEIAAEKSQAAARDTALREEIALLETEKAALEKEAAEFDAGASDDQKRLAEQAARGEAIRATIDAGRPALERAESALRALRPRLPATLLGDARPLFDALPTTAADAARESDGVRAQRVVALLAQVETLQTGVHSVKETLDTGGGLRRQVDVLYLGLARGFAVASDATWSGVGTPGPSGWTWEARPEIAPEVRAAVDMVARQRTADVVRLPLRVDPAEASP